MENFREKIFTFYHTTDTILFNKLIDQSEQFDLKKVLAYSKNEKKISMLAANASYQEMYRLNALSKTSVYTLSQAVLSPDNQYCVMFYIHFEEGGYTVVLKNVNGKWNLYSKSMDFII